MKVLITGSSGLLGSELIKTAQKEKDFEIRVFRSKASPKNILNKTHCSEALNNIDIVIHLAALMDNKNLVYDDYYKINVLGTKILREEALQKKIRPFIYISTMNVYDNNKLLSNGFKETSPTKPITNYAKSKLLGENELCSLDQSGLLIYRASNIVGSKLHAGSLLGGIIDSMQNKKKISIYGDGKRVYDFICAKYFSEIIIEGIKSSLVGLFNIGCGEKSSVYWMAEEIQKLTSLEIVKRQKYIEKNDAYMDCSKIELLTKVHRPNRKEILLKMLKQNNLIG